MKKYKEIIEAGKWNFVLRYGIIWGFFMAIFFILLDKFIYESEVTANDVTFNFILFVIFGLIVGLWTWKIINKKVKKK